MLLYTLYKEHYCFSVCLILNLDFPPSFLIYRFRHIHVISSFLNFITLFVVHRILNIILKTCILRCNMSFCVRERDRERERERYFMQLFNSWFNTAPILFLVEVYCRCNHIYYCFCYRTVLSTTF